MANPGHTDRGIAGHAARPETAAPYDLAAIEREMRAVEADLYAEALGRAETADARAFVELQHRMIEVTLVPRLEALRTVNEGREPAIAIAAFACSVAGAIHSMATLFELPFSAVGGIFADALEHTHEALEREGAEANRAEPTPERAVAH